MGERESEAEGKGEREREKVSKREDAGSPRSSYVCTKEIVNDLLFGQEQNTFSSTS